MDYKTYIISNEWRDKHKDFLKRSHYRCAFFPWVRVGKKHLALISVTICVIAKPIPENFVSVPS
jgi:hypothetical protein